jgi:ABC-type multidrug transport system ATPase subunit
VDISDSSLQTFGLGRDFGDRTAVDGLDLSVRPGEIYGLLGPNGSGKSTTLRMLTTMLRPTRGSAVVAGADVTRDPAAVRARIGVVLQSTALDPLMTGRELLRLQGRVQGLSAARSRARCDELLDAMAMGEHAGTAVGRLSGGQRRRIDLAVSLVQRPAVLFLDEPTTGLDPASRRALWAQVVELNAEHGVTVLLTTQYLEEADRLCHRVGILRAGALAASSAPQELKDGLGERALSLRFGDAATAGDALRLVLERGETADPVAGNGLRVRLLHADAGRDLLPALSAAGLHPQAMSVDEPSLEDVYLRLSSPSLPAESELAR